MPSGVHFPVEWEVLFFPCLPDCGFPGFAECGVFPAEEVEDGFHKSVGAAQAVGERLEHVRFGHKADRIPERGVSGGIAAVIAECDQAAIGRFRKSVHIRRHLPTAVFHILIQEGKHCFFEEGA